jgi:hypothetical protein
MTPKTYYPDPESPLSFREWLTVAAVVSFWIAIGLGALGFLFAVVGPVLTALVGE